MGDCFSCEVDLGLCSGTLKGAATQTKVYHHRVQTAIWGGKDAGNSSINLSLVTALPSPPGLTPAEPKTKVMRQSRDWKPWILARNRVFLRKCCPLLHQKQR
ncbi:hypothetical protein MiSe_36920 [Microseira wollei NIES-4236]|uniref:Transposase n=1 Tax=Microseira wollei NIES-4236 TaxID=2530354 RepID=A0AAV3XEY0_9CYAN|nr:hypothetical protein MiSe_36920 [Microseira wollei NIES-4236]